MSRHPHLDEDRLFPVEPQTRAIVRGQYAGVRRLLIKLDRQPARAASAAV